MDHKEHHKPTDRVLVERVLSGNTRAFGSIIRDTEGLVAQIVFKMIPDREERRDIAQDIYLKVFQKLDSFRFQSKLSTWIARIAYNTCINQLEKNKASPIGNEHPAPTNPEDEYPQEYPDAHDLEENLTDAELNGLLESEIEKLPALYKLLITLYHRQELSYAEIAQIVALPEGTIKSYLFRARKILRERIQMIYNKGL
ncbi:RNA polymerase sigma-70 factor (ECF subfamily) [Dyadobacter sp. BE34]|uniref:RNA polymerase sigma-70 factor (ECF subfamily) n=1 Tax=Dyadobacter fermentans TaxID=94254 RepID=A0ABU1QX98_9BACT|nr:MULTISPECIES: sigma-70 family RNA polymerase sigma factor [Dyadobacter]MDR6804895.1 RNA polymerase sigma-70 factor (ECF subfamily) [Dyadobacter fermentans]MDR7043346.1 RNA polymerase sigma-70 factor (ECF subfamily) [Dyadobacter sp. BE242]MDR7197658.1 RNA polymerase sigma-70 factor (ECF subfamily) [Dyadobacter sp. BE34]MDR7214909.1 RNA polymerase sigma-70 factor (ECF subfamily) [Dyadobacter sp. BE31]MDR7262444.1 RNA polymerase sigma-70 factor (ECF subfamily) [Dyadobacter sp. BE32]